MLTPKGLRHHEDDGEASGPRFHRAAIAPGLVLALGVGGFVTFTAFMPDFSVTVGLDGSKWVFATYAGVCLLIRVVAATVPDRIGHARAVTFALTFMGTGLAMLFLWPEPIGVFVSTIIMAVGISFNYPSLMAMTVDVVPERERVRAISTFTMFFEIGTASGALLFGALADITTKRTAFLGGAAFCFIGLVVLWKVAVPRIAVVRGCLNSASQRSCSAPQWRGDPRRRTVLPGCAEPRQQVRRLLHHGRQDHRDLLPAELPGDDPEATQRRVLRHGCRRAATRVSRMQAMPARRVAWFTRVERSCRCRRTGDAADRRRSGRSRRCRRTCDAV